MTLLLIPLALAIGYCSGVVAQFIAGYSDWQAVGGVPGDGTAPSWPSFAAVDCLRALFRFPEGLIGLLICVGALGVLVLLLMLRSGAFDGGRYDEDRNFHYSDKGTYGTSGFMTPKEAAEVLDLASDLRRHTGTVLGLLDGKFVCVPRETRLNANMAVYGASGSMKTRAFCVNRILQSAARGESLITMDPKSELYEKTSAYMRGKGYTVRVFNLVSPENSDSWNCLAEIEGDELMAQLFCDVVIKNTGAENDDHFWSCAEQNLLKALVLYVDLNYPPDKRNIGEVYRLLSLSSEKELNALFDVLPASHPAKAPYAIFRQSSETVRSGVIIGLGSRLTNYTPEYRETSGVGRRKLLTMDEVLRLPITKALVIVRGKKLLEVDKCDYTKHPEASKLRDCKASAHIPAWRAAQSEKKTQPMTKTQEEVKPSQSKPKVKETDKKSILRKENV